MAPPDAATPIGVGDVRAIFERGLRAPLLVAVSGGADSIALLHLIADWREACRAPQEPVTIATVDHGLRPDAAEEARFVAAVAGARGLAHVTLAWRGAKPSSGLQEAARTARYELLAAAALARGLSVIVTAHHEDDLAETLLQRLARGSGVRGLGGMTQTGPLPLSRLRRVEMAAEGLAVARPLLGFPKARLQATLVARGLQWREDLSNQNAVFERVRWRAARESLTALGLENQALARSARRLARADAAVAAAAAPLLADSVGHPSGALARIALSDLTRLPEEVAIRVLDGVLTRHGGQAEAAGLAQVEALCAALLGGQALTTTLGGAVITSEPARDSVTVWRERRGGRLPTGRLAAGGQIVWDLRYRIRAGAGLTRGVEIAALGEAGWRIVAGQAPEGIGSLQAAAGATLPGLWDEGRLVAVPSLRWADAGVGDFDVQVEFLTSTR